MTYATRSDKANRQPKNWRKSRQKPYEGQEYSAAFQLVEKMFWLHKSIKKAVEEMRAEQGYYAASTAIDGVPTGNVAESSPTERTAVEHIAPIERVTLHGGTPHEEVILQPEMWLFVVTQTLDFFKGGVVYEVLRRRYLSNEIMIKSCIDIGIDKDKYYRLRNAGINYAKECAIQIGILKVF